MMDGRLPRLRPQPVEPRRRFLDLLAEAVGGPAPARLVLAKYHGPEPELVRVQARRVDLKGAACVSFVYRYRTRDVTLNLPVPQALQRVDELLGGGFREAHLHTKDARIQLSFSKRGKALLSTTKRAGDGVPDLPRGPAAQSAGGAAAADAGAPARAAEDVAAGAEGAADAAEAWACALAHNRPKQRPLSIERPFLRALGVTDQQGRLIPSMARKWKQINRFIEVFAAAWQSSSLRERQGRLRLIDFGAGKGYLTFALHDYLQSRLGEAAQTTGVELRPELVKTCNDIVAALDIDGLVFSQGDIASYRSGPAAESAFDVMIALHACDTATDDAIHRGIRAGAAIIMCAPCCHKQLRPQLLSPHPLRPVLQHGIHLGQHAEMLTDGLRALLLEACGYETQVFEFVSLEHTSKNKMILAVKRGVPRDAGPLLAQVAGIKSSYGIGEQRLESLLQADGLQAGGRPEGATLPPRESAPG